MLSLPFLSEVCTSISSLKSQLIATCLAFVKTVKDFPGVFLKSQTPEARKGKAESLKEIKQRYVKNFGKDITETQVLKKKKVSNMKQRLKKENTHQENWRQEN
jgi:hypothetical protein